MKSLNDEAREEALKGLLNVLKRANANDGRFDPADAYAAQIFSRGIAVTTNGGAYGITTYLNGENRDAVLAAAARAVHPETAQ